LGESSGKNLVICSFDTTVWTIAERQKLRIRAKGISLPIVKDMVKA
jgi:hypothetical protein